MSATQLAVGLRIACAVVFVKYVALQKSDDDDEIEYNVFVRNMSGPSGALPGCG